MSKDLPNHADMVLAEEIDNLGVYTRAKRIRQYVNAEVAKAVAESERTVQSLTRQPVDRT